MPKKYKKTERRPGIGEYARSLLLATNYVDIYGRKVGLDYATILDRIKLRFPQTRISLKWLQKMGYEMNASGTPLPARRRSRSILARDFVRAQISSNQPLTSGRLYTILRSLRARFPGVGLSLDMFFLPPTKGK